MCRPVPNYSSALYCWGLKTLPSTALLVPAPGVQQQALLRVQTWLLWRLRRVQYIPPAATSERHVAQGKVKGSCGIVYS